MWRYLIVAALALSFARPADSQTAPSVAPEPQNTPAPPPPVPLRHDIVARSISAVDYHMGKTTRVGFRGTDLMPDAAGTAEVKSKGGRTAIDAKFGNLSQPNTLGLAYLTYVVWAISPEGRPTNLGELFLHDGKGEMRATTELQSFGMIVTAEPDFAVTEPSDRVVLENKILPRTKGATEPVVARYEVLPRSVYLATNEPMSSRVYGVDKNAPLDLLEARNAVRIARDAGAPEFAPGIFAKAQQQLSEAESDYSSRQSKEAINTVARQAIQTAEEARVIAIRQSLEEQRVAERRATEREAVRAQQAAAVAQLNAAAAQAQADQQAQQNQETQAQLQAEQQARQQAQQQALNAQAAAQQAQQQQQQAEQQAQQQVQQADAAKQAALQQQQAAEAEAQRAQQAAQQAERDKEQTRARLLQQLNQVLQTKDTASGLIVDMPDVLFDTGKATLRTGARVRLAKVAGIILAYPDLHLKVEGFTDSVGSDQYNLKLSEMRAATVRDYLISQGVPVNNVVAEGFGKANPIASNATAEGRQENRRVDLVVTGTAIGMQLTPR